LTNLHVVENRELWKPHTTVEPLYETKKKAACQLSRHRYLEYLVSSRASRPVVGVAKEDKKHLPNNIKNKFVVLPKDKM
jgi:hypothetical protein